MRLRLSCFRSHTPATNSTHDVGSLFSLGSLFSRGSLAKTLATMFVIVWCLVTCVLCEDPEDNSETAAHFRVTPDNYFSKGYQYYRVLRIDGSSLYVGAMNNLYKLWVHNVNDSSQKYAEIALPASPAAMTKCAYRSRNEMFQKFHCQNHIRVVLKQNEDTLYVCSTNAYDPSVSILDANDLRLRRSESGLAICPVDPDDNGTAVWVAQGNPDNIPSIYAGTVTDKSQTNRIIYRPPLFDESGSVRNPFMRTMHTDSKWLNEPNFVGSFDIGDYVYFFFREVAVEFTNCGKGIYSRVARICKNDRGGLHVLIQNWATFLKARLNCSIAAEFPFYFDEIQDVKFIDFNGEPMFVATFTTPLTGFYGSAVCFYRLQDVNQVFDSGDFKEQASSQHIWIPAHEATVPVPRPGQCSPDTQKISDNNLSFIKSHPLMNSAVYMFGLGSGSHTTPPGGGGGPQQRPVFYRSNVVLTKLVTDSVFVGGSSFMIIFAGSSKGEIYKILSWSSPRGSGHSSLLAIFSLPRSEPVRALEVLSNEYLYIAQDGGVSQVSVRQCTQYKLCKSCTADPYCAWNTVRSGCFSSDDARSSSGWVQINPSNPRAGGQCPPTTRRVSRLLYPGDSAYLDCPRPYGSDVVWQFNNRTLETGSSERHLLTVDKGLVIVNAVKEDAGYYECVAQRQLLVSYQVFIDDVNCQKPQNAQAYQTVYREWCREFQQYKSTMLMYKKQLEDNHVQCANSQRLNRLSTEFDQTSNSIVDIRTRS